MNVAYNTTLKLPACSYTPKPYRGPSKAEVLETRKRYLSPALFLYYRDPLMLVDGHMQYVFDETGKRYLDFIGGIVTVSCGHCHPKIIARTKEQIDHIQHTTTIYLNPVVGELAKKLASKMPPGLDVTYFVNSGSEANDLAILMSRLYTGNFDVLALKNGYHGGVTSVMGLTSHNTWKFPIPQGYGVHHVACPDPYRSAFSGTADEIAEKSAEDVLSTIRFATPGKVAAYIAEPIQGVGGATLAQKNYLKLVYETVRKHGGLCIADEVQTGFGRTGDHYWGFENYDVIPDIVTMAKGLGNGVPIAAVTTRREIAASLNKVHFNTFGGNPVSAAQALATMEVIDEEGLQENSRKLGTHMLNGFRKLMEKHQIIGDVRGKGLMIGVELVRDRRGKEPASSETLELLERAREYGLLLAKGGLFGNVLRIKPPMCINMDDANFALDVIERLLSSITGK